MARDPNIEKAYKLWIEAGGNNSSKGILESIAEKLGKTPATIRSWKSRYKWGKEKSATQQKKECNATKNATKKKKKEKVVSDEILDIMVNDELTDKQRLFCIYYMQSFNATQSAIKAGYSKNTAMEQGSRLLRNVKVKEHLNELKILYAHDSYLDGKRILERHNQVALSDVKDFVDFKTENTFVCWDEDEDGNYIRKEDGTKKPILRKKWTFNIKDDDEVDGTLIKKIGMGKNGPVIELEERNKSLDFLTKFHGLDPKLELEKERLKNGAGGEKEEKLSISEMRKKYGL